MEQHGRIMTAPIKVPVDLQPFIEKLSGFPQKSFDAVSSPKPKPTKKKK
ncbi:MAG: hypothetical protein AB3N16_15800 [Flavobacteriaceae bacterium]